MYRVSGRVENARVDTTQFQFVPGALEHSVTRGSTVFVCCATEAGSQRRRRIARAGVRPSQHHAPDLRQRLQDPARSRRLERQREVKKMKKGRERQRPSRLRCRTPATELSTIAHRSTMCMYERLRRRARLNLSSVHPELWSGSGNVE